MTCDDVRPQLVAFHLGAVDGPARGELEAHLLTCSPCVAAFLSTRRVHDDAAAFDERPSAQARARVRASFLQRPAPARLPPRRALVWVAGAAAAVVLILLGLKWLDRPAPLRDSVDGLVDSLVERHTNVF